LREHGIALRVVVMTDARDSRVCARDRRRRVPVQALRVRRAVCRRRPVRAPPVTDTAPETARVGRQVSEPSTSQPLLLRLDRETQMRTFLGDMLEIAGCRPVFDAPLPDGLVLTARPGAIIADVRGRAPGRDELDVLDALRGRWPGIPIIVTSALPDINSRA